MARDDEGNRLDRELMELLNELRVALPGVQVLFAFMLTVPFAARFQAISRTQKGVFFAAFLLTTAAVAVLVAPTAYHRLRWRRYDKAKLLSTSNRLAIAGLGLLAGSTSLVVYLIADVLFETGAALASAAGVAGLFAWFWFGLGLSRAVADANGKRDRDDAEDRSRSVSRR